MQGAVCLVTQAENRAQDRIERRDALIEVARSTLELQFLAAAGINPMARIPTPGWADAIGGRREATLVDVLSDEMGGTGSDQKWVSLIGILARCPEGQAWLRAAAAEYAAFHATGYELEAA